MDGTPRVDYAPATGNGIAVSDSDGVIIRNCQVSRCGGIVGGNATSLQILDCHVYSTRMGIFTGFGSKCTARGNYVHDSTRYGVFLWNGPEGVIDSNYVAWTGREGIGTNGDATGAKYTNNVILHTGWTAINVEGSTDDFLVEGNLVVDSHYGIILGGSRTVCRKNQVFYGSQAGIYAFNCKEGLTIEDNLIVGSGGSGIDISGGTLACDNARVVRNRVYQSGTAINLVGKNAVAEGNDVYRFFHGISVNGPGCVVRGNTLYAGRNPLWVTGVTEPGTIVSDNTVHHCLEGVRITKSKGVTFAGNQFSANGIAFVVTDCGEITIRDTEARRIAYPGLTLTNSTGCMVENNRFLGTVMDAAHLEGGSSGNNLRGNTFSEVTADWGTAALMIAGAKGNTITDNTFSHCSAAIAWDGKEQRGQRR